MKYEKPHIDICILDVEDVILTSGVKVNDSGDNFGDITIEGL